MPNPNAFSSQNGDENSYGVSRDENHDCNLTNKQLSDWLRLMRDRRWSLTQKRLLIEHFDDPSQLYQSSAKQLQQLARARNSVTPRDVAETDIEGDMQWLSLTNHALITINDKRYPPLLKEIHDPPIALLAKGDLSCLDDPKVAMVGSRRPTPIGSKITGSLAKDLANLGIVVTSGMALGVDAAAHQGALGVGAPTIAVMGCGLDTIYPSRHRALFEQIADSGCLLSEFPLGLKPTKYSFPQRNRIISGLSLGVVIVEAAERSGTLITARLAVEQNRQLMVVPGSALSANYKGSLRLMQQGAAIVTELDDILQALAIPLRSTLAELPDNCSKAVKYSKNKNVNPLLEHIGYEATIINDIIWASGLTAAEVSSMLLMLEVDGAIAITDNGAYVRLY